LNELSWAEAGGGDIKRRFPAADPKNFHMTDQIVLQLEPLKSFVRDIFLRSGFTQDHAKATADVLVWAELRGHASHGVLRIPSYLSYVEVGIIDPAAAPEIELEKGAVVRLNAHHTIGPAALMRAADIAAERARDTAVAWVLIKDHSHAGAVGYFAQRIARQDMIAMVMTASGPLMTYHGTRVPTLSTNPISIGIPGGLLLDMATAAFPMGKIAAARATGQPLPPGVVLDRDGKPTTDPHKAGAPLPMSGAKGSGLSLMIECLTSLVLHNPLLATELTHPSGHPGFRQNGLVVAMDPAVVGPSTDYAADLAATVDAIKAQPRADGFDEVLMPGERGDRLYQQRLHDGIPVSAKTWDQLRTLAGKLNIGIPGD